MTSLRNHLGVLVGVGAMTLAGIALFARPTSSNGLSAADVNVSCGSGQRAIVRQTISAGVPQVSVDCVQGAALPATYIADPMVEAIPAVYTSPMPSRTLATSSAPVVRRVSAPAARSSSVAARRSASWQRKALVIGGSTGVGAGVGALVGGKKGALIGAAIGGGGAALYQATREKH